MRSAPASLLPLSFATAHGRRVRTNFPSGLKRSSHEFRFYRWKGPADDFYGQIRKSLERSGALIGANNMLIAAHTLALDATLVTDNEREFRRVDGLKMENWLRVSDVN